MTKTTDPLSCCSAGASLEASEKVGGALRELARTLGRRAAAEFMAAERADIADASQYEAEQ